MVRPAALVLMLLCGFAASAHAGGGPETTLVVVNEGSPASLMVANRYIKLRGIPTTHVCPIPRVPNTVVITVDEFRELIWAPIEAFLEQHGIEDQIDIITYSADFPYGVNYDPDFKGQQLPQGVQKFRTASLTSMTYLIRLVKQKSKEYLDFNTNQYFRYGSYLLPSHGFRSRHVWSRDVTPEAPEVGEDSPDRYYLSTMLGHTGLQGNTVPEILRYLERGKASDGRRPKGTVYLMEHKDIRARTRMPFFEDTIKELKRRKVKVAVLKQGKNKQDGRVPVAKSDVAGCVAGIAGFNWQSAGSEFCDGAIAEHLTSFGARFDGSGQTKISEFLRYGAVGSAGAVAEPYALHQKFPLPFLHVHYADGCCLAEAFYQSVSGPYQLLVIGDPLARPYASFGTVSMSGPDQNEAWAGTVTLTVDAKPAKGTEVGTIEIWLDGVRIAELEPDAAKAFALDTTRYADGYHEIRAVAVEKSRIETRSSFWTTVRFKNHGRSVTIEGPKKDMAFDASLAFAGKASKAMSVTLLHGNRLIAVAKVSTGSWKAKVDATRFGVGEIDVRARATYEDGSHAFSKPFTLTVESPFEAKKKKRRRKPKKGGSSKGKKGLHATVIDKQGGEKTFPMEMIGRLRKGHFLKRLRDMVKKGAKEIHLDGEFETKEKGFYQLAINAAGRLTITVKGKTVFDADGLEWKRQVYAPVPLGAGWHEIKVHYVPSGNGNLSIVLGGAQVALPLSGKGIRH